MGKVSTQTISIKDPSGDRADNLVIKFNVNVDKEGLFSTTLSKETVKILEDGGLSLSRNRLGNKGYVSSHTMKGVVDGVYELAKEYFSRELIEDKIVIRYSIQTYCSYQLTEGGDIVPNGAYNGTGWRNGTIESNATNPVPYGIQVYVNPSFKKATDIKAAEKKVQYEKFTPFGCNSSKDDQQNLRWLENICSMTVPNGIILSAEIKEMDYTEQRAAFFVGLIKSICSMNEKIKPFISDNDLLSNLIDEGKIGGIKLLN